MIREPILLLATTGALLLSILSGRALSLPSSGDIRLVGSSNGSISQGRVEIFHNNSWGTVCDDSWDMHEGVVVCKQLGFTSAIAVYASASFGQGNGTIWMDDIRCNGNESRLENCQHRGWGVNDCSHSEDAGVACENVTIQQNGNCSFESGTSLCGYKNLRSDDFDWSLSTAGYHWWSYLPRHDHTYGGYYGHYIYVRSSYRLTGKKAQIMSPVLNGVKCLHFYYFMKGSRVGQLNVYVKTGSNRTLLWQNVGPQSAVWIKAIVPIKWVTSKFTIIFEAVLGGSYAADVAIDDIEVFKKPCVFNHTGNCTFEPGHKCGYTQPSEFNVIKWVLHKGRTGWLSNGPRTDHTLGNGYFIYLKTSYRTIRGQKSQLISPEIYGGRCVQFYYYMSGSAPGELHVYIDDGVKRNHIWELTGTQGNKWQKGELPIKRDMGAFKVVFETVAGRNYYGRIALDDIKILNKRCKVYPSAASVKPYDIRNISKEVRLVGGNSTSAGRIEVFYNGKWGTICGTNFPVTSGRVVCRQLGFSDVVMVVPCCSVFGSGKGRILLQDVKCRGQERDIKMCSHRQWGMTTCYHSQDVGVICKTNHTGQNVRLNGSSHNYEGRAEVKIGGIWGTISDSGWDIFDADVFCRQASFAGASEVLTYPHKRGPKTPEWISNTDCNGDETSFWNCNYTTNIQQQQSYWYWYNKRQAGAKCYDLKLFGGKTENEGIVLIRWEGTWGTICNDGWDMKDAQVVCRNLGFSEAKSTKVGYNISAPHKTTSLLSQFECQGDEVSLATCARRSLAAVSHQCTHDNDAMVVCDSKRIVPTSSTSPKTPTKRPASTPKTSPTTTTKPVVYCKLSKKYGKICICGQSKEGDVCYVLGVTANSVSVVVNKTQWNSERFKDMLAKQLTKFCASNSCGHNSSLKHVFTTSDVIIVKTAVTPTHAHVLFIAFDSHTKKPVPSTVIQSMISHDKVLAGFKIFYHTPAPHSSGKKHPNVIMMVGIALGGLIFGAVVIFAIVYRKRKRRLRALVRYRVPDCPPELNLSDDEEDPRDDDRLLTLNDSDQTPLLPSSVVA